MSYRNIITIDPDKQGDKPCIRQTGITVYDVLGWLAEGRSIADIIDNSPELTKADIFACLEFAADWSQRHPDHTYGNERRLMPVALSDLQKPHPGDPRGAIESQHFLQEPPQEPPIEQPQPKSKLHRLIQPFVWLEKRIWEPMLSWGENQAFISLLGLLGNLGLIFAALT